MALVMVFTCMPLTVFAAERDISSLDAYLDNENLAVIVETLLTDLDDRKEEIVPTVLEFVFMLDALKEQAEKDGVDITEADTETYATVLLSYLEDMLADADLNGEIAAYKGIIGMVLGGVTIDLNSVNGILGTLVGVIDFVNNGGTKTWGDLAKLDGDSLKVKSGKKQVAISTDNSSATEIVYALFGFLADNTDVLGAAVKGKLSLGSINGTLKNLAGLDLENEVNGFMGTLDTTINELLYDNLVATWVEVTDENGDTHKEIETPYEESMYKDYTADELLGAALVKLITGKDVDKDTASATAKMTINEILAKYGDMVIASFALDWLNNDLKTMLKDLIENNADFAVLGNVINLSYEFKVESFGVSDLGKNGIFEGLNDLVCNIIDVLVQPAVAKELALKKGGNENITANLTSFFAYVIKTLASNNGGILAFELDGTKYSYDFSGFTADKLAGMKLEDMVIEVFSLFTPSLMGVELPADVDTLEKLALYAAYWAIDKFMVKSDDCAFTTEYKELVFNADGTVKALSYDRWVETIGIMGMEVAVYWLDRSTNINLPAEKVAAYKEAGWKGEDFFDEVVDWAIDYVKGLPAVADELTAERGEKDGYGPWYKLNVILNELIPLNFINGCGDETFVVDTYTLVIGKLLPSLLDVDFAAFADVLSMNKDPENIFNKSVISGVLSIVDNLLFSLFEHDCKDTDTFKKAATATQDGYEGTYCKANGHYIKVTATPATGIVDEPVTDEPVTDEPTTDEPTTDEPVIDEPVIDEPALAMGDIDGNENVNAADARLTLRFSAGLEEFNPDQLAAADVNGDGKVNAADARTILRVSAGLEEFA